VNKDSQRALTYSELERKARTYTVTSTSLQIRNCVHLGLRCTY